MNSKEKTGKCVIVDTLSAEGAAKLMIDKMKAKNIEESLITYRGYEVTVKKENKLA